MRAINITQFPSVNGKNDQTYHNIVHSTTILNVVNVFVLFNSVVISNIDIKTDANNDIAGAIILIITK